MFIYFDNYYWLKNNFFMIFQMIEIERKWKNVFVFYIFKISLNVFFEELDIKNGDIIVIIINIKGLDVVYIGFVCWVDGKLYLFYVLLVMKKVILDFQIFFEYFKNKKVYMGVWVIFFFFLKLQRMYFVWVEMQGCIL